MIKKKIINLKTQPKWVVRSMFGIWTVLWLWLALHILPINWSKAENEVISSKYISEKMVDYSDYSMEEKQAYDYAYQNGITTMSTIERANINGNLTRIEMAKMISNYAINILWLEPDKSKTCIFTDVTPEKDATYSNWVKNACQLGLMWAWISKFRPYDSVTRAEFGTVLSRALNAKNIEKLKELNDATPYYFNHLKYLKEEWIMKNISNPSRLELRWQIFVMLMRADSNYTAPVFNVNATNNPNQIWQMETLPRTDWVWITGLDKNKPYCFRQDYSTGVINVWATWSILLLCKDNNGGLITTGLTSDDIDFSGDLIMLSLERVAWNAWNKGFKFIYTWKKIGTTELILKENRIFDIDNNSWIAEQNASITVVGDSTINGSIPVEEIELNTSRLYIKKWENIEIWATIYPSDATDTTIKWSSSNTAVATVKNGIVYAKNFWDTVITATTSNKKKAQVRVTVTSIDITINSRGFVINDIGSKVMYWNNNDIGIDAKYLWAGNEYVACEKHLNRYDPNHADEYLNVELWASNYNHNNDGKTRVHFINVGRWDATLLEHNGHYGLVDVGKPGTSTTYLSNFLSGKKLDFVLITHEHDDHLGNILEVVNKYVYQGTKFYFVKYANLEDEKSTRTNKTQYCHAFTAMRNRIGNDNNLVYLVNYQGDITLGDSSFKIKVLWNDISQDGYHVDESVVNENEIDRGKLDSENSNSVGVLVKYNNKTILLTADMGEGDEYRVASSLSDLKIKWINVYKLGHHGATTAGYTPLIDFIKPKNVIVSNEKDYIRPYGNINLSAMCYMQYQYNSKLYLTDTVPNWAVIYDFDDDAMYLWDGVRAIKNATANKFPLNLCKYQEENWVKTIDYRNNTTVVGHNGFDYQGKICKLYLEYGNFIVGTRDGTEYKSLGGSKDNQFRAPGRYCFEE